ncbi:hypothetical protein [Myceligenerans indicum]|uniref:Uncharacterized protein n=1 Tax=Myceligenerans indicum TaxID=2593663 RepID=A0ABS1LI89_9MICO|nr:hypothetical protein [Myceligenerans indicum]MBL0885907.1 hypothetical protein [Myceligenerans indicum]
MADGAGQVRSRWEYDVTPGADGNPVVGLPSSSTTVHDGLEYTTRVDAYDEALRPTSSTVVLPDGLDVLTGLAGREFTTTVEYRIDGSVRLSAAQNLMCGCAGQSVKEVVRATDRCCALTRPTATLDRRQGMV